MGAISALDAQDEHRYNLGCFVPPPTNQVASLPATSSRLLLRPGKIIFIPSSFRPAYLAVPKQAA